VETSIKEKVKVLSLFETGKIRPVVFLWRHRIYKILHVSFSYSKNVGREKVFYFSVETESGTLELSFNREKFSWEITRIF
jgi:hypothetical protein